MRKLLLLLFLVGIGYVAKAQTNPFPSTDSLERFINRYIRNSAVESFQNLRLNTALIGLLRYIQGSDLGSGVDTMYLHNGCVVRLITSEPDTLDVSLCGKLDSVTIETATNPNPDTLFEWRSGTRSQVGLIPKGGGSTQLTTIVQKPLDVLAGDSAMGIPDTLVTLYDNVTITINGDSTLMVDTNKIATLDTTFKIMTRAVVVVDTIEYIHSGSSSATYTNTKLINGKLIQLTLENYPVSFITRTGIVHVSAFNSTTGEITLTNGFFADTDHVKIIYRTYAIFLVDGNGDLVTDSNGNYVIVN